MPQVTPEQLKELKDFLRQIEDPKVKEGIKSTSEVVDANRLTPALEFVLELLRPDDSAQGHINYHYENDKKKLLNKYIAEFIIAREATLKAAIKKYEEAHPGQH